MINAFPVHIRVLTKFTEIFSVKGSGRFRAITFCFLTVVFSVVVALMGVFGFTSTQRTHCSRSGQYFLHFGSLFLCLLNHLGPFLLDQALYRLLTPQVHPGTYSAHEVWSRHRYVKVNKYCTQLALRCLSRKLFVYFKVTVHGECRTENLWKLPC